MAAGSRELCSAGRNTKQYKQQYKPAVPAVSSSHNECKQGANLLSKKMPSLRGNFRNDNSEQTKKSLEPPFPNQLPAWGKITGEAESLNATGSVWFADGRRVAAISPGWGSRAACPLCRTGRHCTCTGHRRSRTRARPACK